jgi:hypothetical protein
MIEYLASHKLHIQTKDGNAGAIYGGDKYTAAGVDTDPTGLLGKKGFWLDTNGILKAGGVQTQGAFNGAVDIVDEMRFYNAQGGSLVSRGNLKVAALGGVAGLIGLIISSGFLACDTMYTKVETSGNSAVAGDIKDYFCDVTYSNGLFVAVGFDGISVGSHSNGTIITSPDGITWTRRDSGTSNFLYGVTYINGLFVAVGDENFSTYDEYMGTIYKSSDGITWQLVFKNFSNPLRAIAYGGGLYVAVGDEGTIITSLEINSWITWTTRTSGTSEVLRAVAYGNGLFVAVGNIGTVLTSPDGVTWTARSSGVTGNFNGVAYGNGLFVTVGQSGTILSSPDGTTWTSRTSVVTGYLNDVTYSNGLFVAVGYDGRIITSPDGTTWTSKPDTSPVNTPISVAYSGDKFVVVGAVGGIGYFVSDVSTQKVGAGFTGKILDGDSTKYRLFDGRTLKLNSGGSVTWE